MSSSNFSQTELFTLHLSRFAGRSLLSTPTTLLEIRLVDFIIANLQHIHLHIEVTRTQAFERNHKAHFNCFKPVPF
jgi:hypothetical protein